MRTCLSLVASATLIILTAGCGGTMEDGPSRSPAAGTITVDGDLLASGSLTLRPEKGPATGCEVSTGVFSAGSVGAVPGPQEVTVSVSDWLDGEDGIAVVSINIPEDGDTEIAIALNKEDVMTEDQFDRRQKRK